MAAKDLKERSEWVWQRNLGYEGGGYAASGKSGEVDDEVDVWSNVDGSENE